MTPTNGSTGDADPMSRDDGTDYALPDPMEYPPEQNNLAARVRTLEAVVRQLQRQLELQQQSTDRAIAASHATWQKGVDEISKGVRGTHDLLYLPKTGAFARLDATEFLVNQQQTHLNLYHQERIRLDRLEQNQLRQGKMKTYLIGVATSGALLVLGSLLGKLLGVK